MHDMLGHYALDSSRNQIVDRNFNSQQKVVWT